MQIITRRDAISQKLTKYFTGELCRNGHLAERYTSSAVCKDCLHPKFERSTGTSDAPTVAIVPQVSQRERKLLLAVKLTRAIFMLYDADLDAFRFMHLTLSQSRDESVRDTDLLTGLLPRTFGLQRRHIFRVFPEHVQPLRDYADALNSARSTPVVAPIASRSTLPDVAR